MTARWNRRGGVRYGAAATSAALAAAVLLAGCGAGRDVGTAAPAPTKHHGMTMNMQGMDMSGMRRPTAAARMICTDETRRHIGRILGAAQPPASSSSWHAPTYACSYQLAVGGELVLSVNDATKLAAGRQFFDSLRERLAPTQRLKGLQAFGLPAFQTTSGDVVFLKDGKTLLVDASALASAALPPGQSRADIAYAVAADVVACWSE